jgi:hypothetical protein
MSLLYINFTITIVNTYLNLNLFRNSEKLSDELPKLALIQIEKFVRK